MDQPIPAYIGANLTPYKATVEVCGLCHRDWDAHERVARARWDASYSFEDVEPGETLPSITVEPVDCIIVLRRAAQGPPGPPGHQGAMGMRGEKGEKGEPGLDAEGAPLA